MVAGTGLSLVILLISIAIYVVLTYKGTSPIVSALIATAVLSLFTAGGFAENFFTVFPGGIAMMIGGFFMIFTFGFMFGKIMEVTGVADSIGMVLFAKMGEKNVIYVLMAVTMLFAMSGPPHFALMPPIAFALMRSAKLPRYVGLVAVAGAGTAATVLPGCLTTANVLPAEILGTTIYDGAALGVIACIIQLILVIFFVNRVVKKCRAEGAVYDPRDNEPEVRAPEDRPPFAIAIVPIILAVGLAALFVIGLGWASMWAMVAATTIGMVYMMLTCRKWTHTNLLVDLKEASERVQPIIVSVCAVCGFATVVANTAIYQQVIPSIMGWDVHPAVIIVLGEMLIVAMCADPISGIAAFSSTIGKSLIEQGVNAGMVHRLAELSCYTFDTMPHGGAVTMAMRMFGYDLKDGYKYMFMVNLVFPFVYSIICMFVAMGIYPNG